MTLSGKFVLPIFFLTLFLGAMILGPLLYFGLAVVWPIPFHRALLISAVAALGLFWSRILLGKLWPWSGDASASGTSIVLKTALGVIMA